MKTCNVSAMQSALNLVRSYKSKSLTGNTMQTRYKGSSRPSRGWSGKERNLFN